jgi:hypothetical protein
VFAETTAGIVTFFASQFLFRVANELLTSVLLMAQQFEN